MFRAEGDGSAVVYHVPVRPFVSVQHNKIDVLAVNRIANFALRFAMEHDWCCPPHQGPLSAEADESVGEGYMNLGRDVTVFFAGVDVELVGDPPRPDDDAVPASIFFWSQLWVSHVGTSSFGMHGKLYSYGMPNDECRVPFGVFTVTCVAVSSQKRKPVPIAKEWAAVLRDALEKNKMDVPPPKMTRLNVGDLLKATGLFVDDACCHVVDALPTHASVAPLRVAYRREFTLRQTDIDFNGHVNQLAMMQLVINAFRSALSDQTTVFPRLLKVGMGALLGDLLLRRLRIDYVQEIPMHHKGVAVTLFFLEEAARDAVIGLSGDSQHGEMVELCFVAHGMPGEGDALFIAVVGKLFFCI